MSNNTTLFMSNENEQWYYNPDEGLTIEVNKSSCNHIYTDDDNVILTIKEDSDLFNQIMSRLCNHTQINKKQ